MSTAATLPAGDLSADDLKRSLRRQHHRRLMISFALIAPLALFLLVNFILPVGLILFKAIDDREVSQILPRTTAALESWSGDAIPGEPTFAALYRDLQDSLRERTIVKLGKRLNSAQGGFNALVSKTARTLPEGLQSGFRDAFLSIDRRWGELVYWAVLERTSSAFTAAYLLAAFDLTRNAEGEIVLVPEYRRIFVKTWLRTFWMASVITVICILLGYPLAFVMANAPLHIANVLMIVVLIPFWTSLLVRTTAWLVLLQDQGVVNDLGLHLHLWEERVQLIRNRPGVYVTMCHILLPFMVLPLYAIMRRIPPSYMRAAKSLGAKPYVAFWRVYFPLTRHGIGAGAVFVFILAIGFYVTPALVGGRNDQMISYFIAFYTNEVLNWGAAAAMSAVLLLFTGLVFLLFKVIFRLDRMQIGH